MARLKTRRRRYRVGHWFKTRPVSRKCQWNMPWNKRSDCCKFQFNLERSDGIKMISSKDKAAFLELCRKYFDSLSDSISDRNTCIEGLKTKVNSANFDEPTSVVYILDAIESALLPINQEKQEKQAKQETTEHTNQYTGRQWWWNRSHWFK